MNDQPQIINLQRIIELLEENKLLIATNSVLNAKYEQSQSQLYEKKQQLNEIFTKYKELEKQIKHKPQQSVVFIDQKSIFSDVIDSRAEAKQTGQTLLEMMTNR